MRIGVTRAALRSEAQIEAGESTGAGHSTQTEPRINHLLNRIERQLATEYAWPTLSFETTVPVAANAQFVNMPANVVFTDTMDVRCKFGNDWLPVFHGITPEHRALYDSTARTTPIMRWEIQYPGTTQFEVWPRSAQAETLLFTALRQVGAMATDAATCVIDGDVLVLRVAAALLIAKKDYDGAKAKIAEANARVRSLLYRQTGVKQENVSMAGRPAAAPLRPGLDFIPPSS